MQGPKFIELLYSIMNLNTISLPTKARPINGLESVFCCVPVHQLTILVSSVAFFYYLPTNNPQSYCQQVGSKNSLYTCINRLLTQQLPIFLPTYVCDLLPREKLTINSDEVHPQLSNKGRPVDGALVGATSSLWP